MSLVAYGSSDESSDEEEAASESVSNVESSLINKTRTALRMPAPKDPAASSQTSDDNNKKNPARDVTSTTDEPALFKNLPKPKQIEISTADETEDDIIPPQMNAKSSQDKNLRKNRAPVKISLPSLSEFKDVDDEQEERKRNRIKPSEKGTGLFSILPPPKGSTTKATIRSLIPDVVKRAPQTSHPLQPRQIKVTPAKAASTIDKKTPLTAVHYDSDSDEESSGTGDASLKTEGKIDFFSLATSSQVVSPVVATSDRDFFSLSEEPQTNFAKSDASDNTTTMYQTKRPESISQAFEFTDQMVGSEAERPESIPIMESQDERDEVAISDKTLTSNVMNLPKEEIRMKNKAEVGPKLPVPEQEYNVDSQGNVAFDEKAIEYLCGKRGVKRKNKDFDEANIIEINGEDIKPDEREWLVKALTEEAAERPASMESAGPSTQSRKKHQITYLAHQAKAMEVELKNQWAQNRVTRKQTQSKYGF